MVFWYIKWYGYMSKYTIHIIYQNISKIICVYRGSIYEQPNFGASKDSGFHLRFFYDSFDSRPGSWRRATSSAQVLPWAQKSDWGMDEILPFSWWLFFPPYFCWWISRDFLISCVCWRVVNDILKNRSVFPAGSLGSSGVFNATPSNILVWEQPWRTYSTIF